MSDPWVWWSVHGAALLTVIGALLQLLPAVAAAAGAIYYLIQVWETRTIQHWWNNRKMRLKAEKIARLRAKEKVIQAQLEAEGEVRQARAKARAKVEAASQEAAALLVQEQIDNIEKPKSNPEP